MIVAYSQQLEITWGLINQNAPSCHFVASFKITNKMVALMMNIYFSYMLTANKLVERHVHAKSQTKYASFTWKINKSLA